MAKSKKIQSVRSNQRTYLAKDFESLRSELVQYGNIYFKDQVSDFSENGLAGMFVEMAAYVGDVLSFYLDHQFNELDIQTAVESQNIERLVRAAGVKIKGASPSTAVVDFYIEVPAEYHNNQYIPKVIALPTIKAGTIVTSNSGVSFELQEDLIFSKLDSNGIPTADYKQMKTKTNGDGSITPTTFSVLMTGDCRSGIQRTETFSIADTFEPFRTITLGSANVSEIISISDSSGNQYYEVESLTQDVVYKRVLNVSSDSDLSPENLELIPAPYRFLAIASRRTSKTTIRFGGGSALSNDDDILPDPSEVSIKLYGDKKTFSRFTLDPNALLKTRTLGIAPRNTTITVSYRAGGGLSHNVTSNSINTVSTLLTKFPASTPPSVVASVRASTECKNPSPASGGESPQTLNELRATALAFKNSQGRIVTKSDLIARIYAMPSNFGRVFRVGVNDNPNNPLSAMCVKTDIGFETVSSALIALPNFETNLTLKKPIFSLHGKHIAGIECHYCIYFGLISFNAEI